MEVFPQDNAASTNPEVNAIGSFYPNGASTTVTTDGTAPYAGSWNIRGGVTGTINYAIVNIDIPAIIGHNYQFNYWYKSTQYNQQRSENWDGVVSSTRTDFTQTVWTEVTDTVEATATTITCNFFVSRAAGAAGDILDLDLMSVIDLDAPATTTVEVTWIDSISAAATGNKIYRDDVEIADIANGIQTYQDDTAETGTEYKYEVQAYSATDETTQEVLGVNTQFITTA